jgi:hypothetical protein
MSKNLSNVQIGLALALICLLLNIGLGVLFGFNEDWFQDYIKTGIAAHPQLHTPHSQDSIWRWVQRAHFHAGGIGAFSLGLMLATALSDMSAVRKQITAALIGLSICYPLAWLTMFFVAPAIGTKAAHGYWLVDAFTYVGVGALALGLLSLIGGLFWRPKSRAIKIIRAAPDDPSQAQQ